MVSQGFSIGDRDWYIMCFYDVRTRHDLREVRRTLLSAGCSPYKADEACWVLSMWNKGYTFTNVKDHLTISVMSKATSPEQMYDSIEHELKHIVEHIGEYYGVDPKGEESAYLQGEIGRQMFPAAAVVICPNNSTLQG